MKGEVLQRKERCECCNRLRGVVMKRQVLKQNERCCNARRGVSNIERTGFVANGGGVLKGKVLLREERWCCSRRGVVCNESRVAATKIEVL